MFELTRSHDHHFLIQLAQVSLLSSSAPPSPQAIQLSHVLHDASHEIPWLDAWIPWWELFDVSPFVLDLAHEYTYRRVPSHITSSAILSSWFLCEMATLFEQVLILYPFQ